MSGNDTESYALRIERMPESNIFQKVRKMRMLCKYEAQLCDEILIELEVIGGSKRDASNDELERDDK